ncbi:MAG: hypothetical protein WBA92_04965, partial [Pseudorhodobacter sp.]
MTCPQTTGLLTVARNVVPPGGCLAQSLQTRAIPAEFSYSGRTFSPFPLEVEMLRHFLISVVFGTFALPLQAADWNQMAYYLAYIGPEDMRSSSGKPVTT